MDITLIVLILIIIACLIGLDWECGYEYMIPKKWRKKKMINQISENVRRGLETKRMLRQLCEASDIVTALQNAIECIESLNEQIERDEITSDKLFDIRDTLETIKQEKMCTVEFLEDALIERL